MDNLHDLVTINDIYTIRRKLKKGLNPNETIGSSQVTPLHVAAQFNRKEAAQILLESGADLKARTSPQGLTPLDIAINFQHFEMMRLLDRGKTKVLRAS